MKIDDLNLIEGDTIDFTKTLVGTSQLKSSDSNAGIAAHALGKAAKGKVLTGPERDALADYVDIFVTMITNSSLRARLLDMKRLADKIVPSDKKDDDDLDWEDKLIKPKKDASKKDK